MHNKCRTFLNRNVGVISIPMFRVLTILALVTVSACERKNPEEKIKEIEDWKIS
jgi:hypothetical protein